MNRQAIPRDWYYYYDGNNPVSFTKWVLRYLNDTMTTGNKQYTGKNSPRYYGMINGEPFCRKEDRKSFFIDANCTFIPTTKQFHAAYEASTKPAAPAISYNPVPTNHSHDTYNEMCIMRERMTLDAELLTRERDARRIAEMKVHELQYNNQQRENALDQIRNSHKKIQEIIVKPKEGNRLEALSLPTPIIIKRRRK